MRKLPHAISGLGCVVDGVEARERDFHIGVLENILVLCCLRSSNFRFPLENTEKYIYVNKYTHADGNITDMKNV